MPNNPSSNGLDTRQQLSALMDGALAPAEVRRLVQSWELDADVRQSWHAYHLAADVMRSDELASHGARDAQFLARLRDRLAVEPVPLATVPLVTVSSEASPGASVAPAVRAAFSTSAAAARPGRQRLLVPAAMAAGVMSVAGILSLMRPPASPPADVSVAAGPATKPASAGAPAQQVGWTVVRDARLDRYLQAHRKNSSSMLQAPGVSEQPLQVVFEKP